MAIDQYFNEVERLRNLGRYGDAYRYTQEHEADLELTTDLGEVRKTIRHQARAAIDQAQAELDVEMARDLVDFDRDHVVDEWIALWQRAVISDSDAELESYIRRVRALRAEQAKYLDYLTIYNEVNDLWERAQRESESSATASVLKELYDRAYEIARDASADHEGNTRLQELAQQAHARRERATIETEALTSGALLGQYVKTLVFIDSVPDGELVPVVDGRGNIGTRHPKAQAREHAAAQARGFIDGRVVDYIDTARRHLDNYKPRAALETLNEYRKFEEPEDPGLEAGALGAIELRPVSLAELLGNDWLSSDRIRQIENLGDLIDQALEKLNEAERHAEAATNVLDRDIVQAWRYYEDALRAYEGAHYSDKVDNVRSALETTANLLLEEDSAQLEGLIQQQNPEEAMHRTKIILDTFQPMQRELRIDSHLRLIDDMHTALREVQDKLDQIDGQLHNDNLDAAARIMRALENDFHLRQYYEVHPLYERLKGEVTLRLNAEAELERLREYLGNPRRDRVQRALDAARTASERDTAFTQEFDDLALNLDAHLLFLDLDRLLASEGYDEVIAQLEHTITGDGLQNDLRNKLIDRLEDIRHRSRELDRDRDTLTRGQQLLAEGRPGEAYRQLQSIKNFVNLTERRTRDRFLEDARVQWVQQILGRFNNLKIDTEFDRAEFQEALTDLGDLDPDQAQRVRRRYRLYEGAQLARDHANAKHLDAAIEQWQTLLESHPSWEDVAYIRKQIAAVKKQQKEMQIDRLLEPGERGLNADAVSEWISELIEIARELAEDATDTADPIDHTQYLVWRIRVMLTHAQYTPDLKTRRELLHDVSDIARALENQIRTAEKDKLAPNQRHVIDHAKEYIQVALAGPAIGDSMREVEERLQVAVELALFQQAYDRWDEAFAPCRETLPALQRWFDERVHQVQADLREALQRLGGNDPDNYVGLTPDTLPLYAKLLVLDEDDPAGVWMLRQLTQLSGVIVEDVDRLYARAFSPEGISVGQARKALENKRVAVVNYLNYVRLIRDLVELFHGLDALREHGTLLIRTCAEQIPALDELRGKLQHFLNAGESFENFVRNYEPRDDGNNNWHDFEREYRQAWENFLAEVRAIEDDLDQHPWVEDDLKSRFDKRFSELRDLVNLLTGVQDDMRAERFVEAAQKAKTVEETRIYKNMFKEMMLYREVRVRDVWTDSDVMGWDAILQLISMRLRQFEIIVDWSQQFGAPNIVQPEELLNQTAQPDPAVIVWPQIKQRAVIEQEKGNFVLAQQLVEGALYGFDDPTYADKIGLQKALEAVSTPPVAEDNALADYALAQKRAGSRRGRNILEWMERHRYQRYNQYVEEVHHELARINTVEADWDRRRVEFNGLLTAMDEVLTVRMNRRKRRQRLTPLVQEADQMLVGLRRLCPQNPQVTNLENHPVLLEARRASR